MLHLSYKEREEFYTKMCKLEKQINDALSELDKMGFCFGTFSEDWYYSCVKLRCSPDYQEADFEFSTKVKRV